MTLARSLIRSVLVIPGSQLQFDECREANVLNAVDFVCNRAGRREGHRLRLSVAGKFARDEELDCHAAFSVTQVCCLETAESNRQSSLDAPPSAPRDQ